MMLERIKGILESADTAGPVPEERVRAGEEVLGIRFPSVYREFLLSYGAAMGSGWEVYGIDPTRTSEDEPPRFVDVIRSAISERSGPHGRFHPRHLIQIAHDGMELGFYLDLSKESGGECPVLGLGPGVDLVEAAPKFVDFVIGWSTDQLDGFP
jgi:hypothetical protein